MALIKGQNSYADLNDARTYFENRIDADAWEEASDLKKEQALVSATQALDNLEWIGTAVDPLQTLAFPRVGFFFDKKIGNEVSLNPTPQRITIACFEMALHLLNNEGLLNSSGNVDSISVGPISLNKIRSSSVIPPMVRNYVKDMLANPVKNAWWRAN